MANRSHPILVKDGIELDFTGAEIADSSALRVFRLNYLHILSWKIDIQQERMDRLEGLIDKVAGYKEAIAEVRSDLRETA